MIAIKLFLLLFLWFTKEYHVRKLLKKQIINTLTNIITTIQMYLTV